MAGVGGSLEVFDIDTGATIKKFQGQGGPVAGTLSVASRRVVYDEGMSWATAAPP